MASSKPKYHFELRKQREGDGTIYYSFLLAGKHLPVKSSVNGSVLRVVDIVRLMPQEIETVSGLKQRVKLVLKIYSRVPQPKLKRHRDEMRYARLLRGTTKATRTMTLTD